MGGPDKQLYKNKLTYIYCRECPDFMQVYLPVYNKNYSMYKMLKTSVV